MLHRLGAATAAALTITTLVPATTAAVEEPTRILIVGDSVTQGARGDVTWRYFAWHALQDAGQDVDFVGPRTGTFAVHDDTGAWDWDYNGPDAYADADFDQDHGAFAGGRLSPEDNFFHEPIGRTAAAADPDLIVSLWGINDLGHADDGPADLIASYRGWVAEARGVDPDVDFVIGRLPQTWMYDGEVDTFNAMLGDLAAELSTPRSRIVVATMTEPYTRDRDSADDVHPNVSGQAKIAGMMGAAVTEVLTDPTPEAVPVVEPVPVLPAPVVPTPQPFPEALTPPAEPAATRPAAPRRVRATRDGRRATVTWRRAARADAYVVRCGRRSRTVTARRVAVRTRAARCSVRSLNVAGTSRAVRVRITG